MPFMQYVYVFVFVSMSVSVHVAVHAVATSNIGAATDAKAGLRLTVRRIA